MSTLPCARLLEQPLADTLFFAGCGWVCVHDKYLGCTRVCNSFIRCYRHCSVTHFGSLCGAIKENMLSCVLQCVHLRIRLASVLANSRLVVNLSETFDVTTVMLSSSTIISQAGEYILVGSDAMLITENVSLHLNATSLLITPNRHICGKTVMWRYFVAQLYSWSMYCCAFWRVK